ncbi:flap endonuclease 1 isoform X2 [Tanacetum coccineum]|uniref:Flap endonuclease 1 isoform X2 n=1 Tax=Tanacetum coccineum TaxID=301880 RepID=A0ABQ5IUX3_9ASTR
MRVPIIEAPSEAEAQCAAFCRADRHVYVVLEGLCLTMDQFIDLCILRGCDYCDIIKGIGGMTTLKLICQHGLIETILENINKERLAVCRGSRLFKEPLVYVDEEQLDIKWSVPNEEVAAYCSIILEEPLLVRLQRVSDDIQMLVDYNSCKDRGKRKLRTRETTDNKKVSKLYDREERMSYQQRQKSKSLGPCVAKGQDEGVADNGRKKWLSERDKKECLAAAKTVSKHPCCSRKGVWLLLKQYPNTPVAEEMVFGYCFNSSQTLLLSVGNQLGLSRINKPKPDEDVFHTENVDLPPCRLPDEIMQEDDSNSVAYTSNKEDVEADTSGKMGSLSLSSLSGRWAKCGGPSVRWVRRGVVVAMEGLCFSSAKDDLLRLRIYEPTSTKDIFDTDNVDLLPCLLVDDKLKEDDSNSVAP